MTDFREFQKEDKIEIIRKEVEGNFHSISDNKKFLEEMRVLVGLHHTRIGKIENMVKTLAAAIGESGSYEELREMVKGLGATYEI
jgi:hypothetical protein